MTKFIFPEGMVEDLGSGLVRVHLPSSGSAALDAVDATILADVTMTSANTFYDGPSALFGAGKWLIAYKVFCVTSGSQSHEFTAKLWDGSTVHDEAESDTASIGAGFQFEVSGVAIVNLAAATTLKVSVADIRTGSTLSRDAVTNSASSHKASRLVGVRLNAMVVGEGATDYVSGKDGTGRIIIPSEIGNPRRQPSSPSADDDEFDQNTSGNPSGWSSIPSGAPDTVDTTTARSHVRLVRNANATGAVFGIYKAYTPSFPFTWEARLADAHLKGDYNSTGLFVAEAGLTGKILEAMISHDSSVEPHLIPRRRLWTNRTTFSGSSSNVAAVNRVSCNDIYFRIVGTSSTSLAFYISWGGLVWYEMESGYNPGFTIGAIGLSVHSQNASDRGEAFYDYVRRTQ